MNRMTLDQLRVFVAVAERQHLTKAAEALNLAQSAVSTAISTLENRSAGPKRRWSSAPHMSAFGCEADLPFCTAHVCF